MKNTLLLLLLAFIINNAFGQSYTAKELILTVEKKPKNSRIFSGEVLQFKPGKVLRIKTLVGRKLVSNKYFLQDSAIVMIMQSKIAPTSIDTISLNDIAFIKGKVFGDSERKLLGGLLALSSIPLGVFPMLVMIDESNPIFVFGIPLIAACAIGISLTGARKFNTTDKWKLKTIER